MNRKIPLITLGAGLGLPLGGLGGDQVQPAGVAGFADRQRHDHPPVLVAARVVGLPGVQGDRDHGAEHQVLDVLAAAQQQVARAGGDGGEQHVVDLGAVRAGDVLGQVEAAADSRRYLG